MTLSIAIEEACGAILTISWQASILAIFVAVAQILFGKWLTPAWKFGLWSIVVARLTLVAGPESAFSFCNYTGVKFPAGGFPENYTHSDFMKAAGAAGMSPTEIQDMVIRLIASVWAAGVLGLAFQWFSSYLRVERKLRRAELVGSAEILNALADAERQLGMPPEVKLLQSELVKSPTLFGVSEPCLALPKRMVDRLSADEWRMVFLHEVAHLKRRDLVTNMWISALQIFHWFNPVLRWVFQQIRIDREVAADAMALAHVRRGEKKMYAKTLLKFVEDPCEGFHGVGSRGVALIDRDEEILWRFRMISRFKKPSPWAFWGIAPVIVFIVVGLTDAKFPKPVTPFSFECIRVLLR